VIADEESMPMSDGDPAVGVIGTGLMGTGIAALVCAAGLPARVFDSDPARLAGVGAAVEAIVTDLAASGLAVPNTGAVGPVADLAAFAGCDVIVEAVVEDIAVKRALYAKLERVVRPDAVIASNTSNIVPSELARDLSHPERFVVAHFWNPPYEVPLVEVVGGPRTSADTIARTTRWIDGIGNDPVVLRREVAGFIGNRLQYALLREALWLVQAGVATAEEVDRVMTLSLGRRYAVVGPFATADLGGLDTFLTISRQLMPQLASDLGPLRVMEKAVAEGNVGAKAGQGLLAWPRERADAVLAERRRELLRRRIASRRAAVTQSGLSADGCAKL
jgi:3-hydroxybutyryl-CoA dehydrogenase